MKIFIDGDACPTAAKNILFKAADKRQIETVLIANHYVRVARSPWIRAMQVPQGFDEADSAIVALVESGDLVITADVPLANDVIDKGGLALSPRGRLYDEENIKSHLQRRDMMEELRSSGVVSGGPDAYDARDAQQFANALDRLLTRAAGASPRA